MKIDPILSERIWEIKGLLIFLVFFAHMPWSENDAIMHKLYALLGIISVPIFLFLSGFLDYSSKALLKNRIKSLVIPVWIWGSATFLISCFINRDKVLGDGVICKRPKQTYCADRQMCLPSRC